MGQNFRSVEREQAFLMPPDVREWLPEGHFAWFVLAAVESFDLQEFYGAYRADGHGRAAYDPAVLLAVLVYAYAIGERSSRAIERRLEVDVAFRVLAANQRPDHATIARFRARHERALKAVFGEVLGLCVRAGLADSGVIAVDSTKIKANASQDANRGWEQLSAEIFAEADAVDAAEQARFGDRRGDELPEQVVDTASRKKWLAERKAERDARRREREPKVPADRDQRLEMAARRLHEDWEDELVSAEALEAARKRRPNRAGRKPVHELITPAPAGKINVTDPDSGTVKTPGGFVQGYNAQTVVSRDRIVLAVHVRAEGNDNTALEPMTRLARAHLSAAGHTTRPSVVVADSGYFNSRHIQALLEQKLLPLTPPDSGGGRRPLQQSPKRGPIAEFMRTLLASPTGARLYKTRQALIEPVFGDLKHNRGFTRFSRRGITACDSEYHLVCAARNLLTAWRHTLPAT